MPVLHALNMCGVSGGPLHRPPKDRRGKIRHRVLGSAAAASASVEPSLDAGAHSWELAYAALDVPFGWQLQQYNI